MFRTKLSEIRSVVWVQELKICNRPYFVHVFLLRVHFVGIQPNRTGPQDLIRHKFYQNRFSHFL